MSTCLTPPQGECTESVTLNDYFQTRKQRRLPLPDYNGTKKQQITAIHVLHPDQVDPVQCKINAS